MNRPILLTLLSLTWLAMAGACARLPAPLSPTGIPPAATQATREIPASTPTPSPDPASTAIPTVDPTLPTPTLQVTRSLLPARTAEPAGDTAIKSQYTLAVSFDYLAHHLAVNETVHFTNASGDTISSLVFDVEPDVYPGDITFKSITLPGGATPGKVSLSVNRMSFPLASPLSPGQGSSVSLVYDLALPALPPPSHSIRSAVFGYTANQANLVDWFPYLALYQPGKGWIIHDPWFNGEHQVYPSADFDVTLALVNPPAGLVIAAPAAAQGEGGAWHYTLAHARTFAWSASPLYKTLTQQVGDVQVTSYVFPLDQRAGQAALEDTAAAMTLYASLFGPYQHTSLSVVEGDFADGMEYDGLFFLSKTFYNLYDGTPRGYLTTIAVHETAHQWFFGQVGSDQAMEPWLDEALATYCEAIFYERTYPGLASWWWSFRVNFYRPSGMINQPIYAFTGFEPYRNAIYLRGAEFLDAVRRQTGDAAFFGFLKDYVAREQYRIATGQDFFDLLSAHTKVDLAPIKSLYFGALPPNGTWR